MGGWRRRGGACSSRSVPSTLGRYDKYEKAKRRRGTERRWSADDGSWSYHVRWDGEKDWRHPWVVIAVNQMTESEEAYDDEPIAWH